MNVTISVQGSELSAFESFAVEAIEQSKPRVMAAMADRFVEMVHGNFGIAGVDRPMAWAPLSPAYAKKVGREIATLYVTGKLYDNIRRGGTEGDSVTVSVSNSDVPYATVHQTGGTRMPKRPYFPIDDQGNVLDYTFSQVTEAACKALGEELN